MQADDEEEDLKCIGGPWRPHDSDQEASTDCQTSVTQLWIPKQHLIHTRSHSLKMRWESGKSNQRDVKQGGKATRDRRQTNKNSLHINIFCQ